MKVRLKSTLAGLVSLAFAGGGVLLAAGPASAGTVPSTAYTPTWETPSYFTSNGLGQEVIGNVVLYDASGNVLTGGTGTTAAGGIDNLFGFAATTTADPNGEESPVTLEFCAPSPSPVDPTQWTCGGGGQTNNPISSPAYLAGLSTSHKLVYQNLNTLSQGADLDGFMSGVNPQSNAAYQNVAQIRMTTTNLQGVSEYWASDVIFCDQTGGCTAPNGQHLALDTWQVLYPSVTTTTTTVSLTNGSPASPQTNPPSAIGLTATIGSAPSGNSGTVVFFDSVNGGAATAMNSGSPATVTNGVATLANVTPTGSASATETNVYTAVFTPTAGTLVQGSQDNTGMTYVVNPPNVNTSTSLVNVSPTSVAQYGGPLNLSTTVTEQAPDAGQTAGLQGGTVVFNATGVSPSVAQQALPGTVNYTVGASSATATLTINTVNLAPGTYDIVAVFTPHVSGYNGSASPTPTSPNVSLTVTAPTCPGSPQTGANPIINPATGQAATCSDQQNITVTVNPGSLTITTPYGPVGSPNGPFQLPAMVLNQNGTELSTHGTFGDVTVTDSLAGDQNWTVSVTATDLTGPTPKATGEYNDINAANLGLGAPENVDAAANNHFTGTVSFTDIAADAGVAPASAGGPTTGGLSAGPTQWATSTGGGDGNVSFMGTLSLNAPPQTQPGTYSGTITFSVA